MNKLPLYMVLKREDGQKCPNGYEFRKFRLSDFIAWDEGKNVYTIRKESECDHVFVQLTRGAVDDLRLFKSQSEMSRLESTSKFLSLILRHQPEVIGLSLDAEGWADVSELVAKTNEHGRRLDLDLLKEVVETNSKKRFAFSDDLSKIRANQGHSVSVDLGLRPETPPDVLYHGTATRFVDSIHEHGLRPGSREHVHLSKDVETAVSVGKRHGKPVVLIIDAKAMQAAGHEFFLSENGVRLTKSVPTSFIKFQG